MIPIMTAFGFCRPVTFPNMLMAVLYHDEDSDDAGAREISCTIA